MAGLEIRHFEKKLKLKAMQNSRKNSRGKIAKLKASAEHLASGIPGDLLGAPMEAQLDQKEAKELLGPLQCQADS